ncbi:hypothetical protein VKT23_016778 [Stygiomarasmius scandens]|uniref:Uncharacterized protein n=1 Tax=Marasmiellus scandens TaxID=2682957 RepID=A0ABR1IVI7_9AGAR
MAVPPKPSDQAITIGACSFHPLPPLLQYFPVLLEPRECPITNTLPAAYATRPTNTQQTLTTPQPATI